VAAARFYENTHFTVGAVSAGLAVAAGGTAFAGETTIAGIAAVLAAVLTGFLTVHRPEERTATHWRAAREYARLYDQLALYFKVGWTRVVDELDVPATVRAATSAGTTPPADTPQHAGDETPRARVLDSTEALARFVKRHGEIEDSSFPVPSRLCRRAEVNISKRDEWIPPVGCEFAEWRSRLMMTRSRSWRHPLRSNPRGAEMLLRE
jgi:hypothetical protein